MQTKPKSNSVVTVSRPEDRPSVIVFKVLGAGELEFDMDKASDANNARAKVHGWTQRLADAAAKGRDKTTGKAASPQVKLDAIRRLIDHYETGSDLWSPARIEGATALDQIILAAVVEATGKTTDEVRALVAAGAEKGGVTERVYLAKLGEAKLVKPIVDRIKGAIAPAIDADDALDAMMSEGEE